jgi:hypothetical protein
MPSSTKEAAMIRVAFSDTDDVSDLISGLLEQAWDVAHGRS